MLQEIGQVHTRDTLKEGDGGMLLFVCMDGHCMAYLTLRREFPRQAGIEVIPEPLSLNGTDITPGDLD